MKISSNDLAEASLLFLAVLILFSYIAAVTGCVNDNNHKRHAHPVKSQKLDSSPYRLPSYNHAPRPRKSVEA